MESLYQNGVNLTLGASVTAVFHNEGRPSAIFCTVHSEAPFFLSAEIEGVGPLTLPSTVMLLCHLDGKLYRGEAEAVSAFPKGDQLLIELRLVKWEDVNRRRYPRFVASVPVALRAVTDRTGEAVISLYQGSTVDISYGGAWVLVQPQVLAGSLVEFQATLPSGQKVKALGVVAHTDEQRNGVGIEFLDFTGNSEVILREFLPQAA